jgi:hypothetical protein
MVTFSSYHVVVLVNVVAMLYPVWTSSLHRFVVFASVLGRSAARVFIHEGVFVSFTPQVVTGKKE